MVEFFESNKILFFDFVVVTLLSLIIGLEQHSHQDEQEEQAEKTFGTDRTFTFIGILGFILYTLDQSNKILFIGGGLILSILLSIFYFQKIQHSKTYSLASILSALITYCLAPLVITQQNWLTLLIVVTVLIFTEMKNEFLQISKKFGKNEFITLAKFILIAGIILPNLPDTPFVTFIPLTPYKIWLGVVVVSGISYFSYLLQKFIFPKSGIIVAGILGGLYSSTAVSIITSRKSKDKIATPHEYATAIVLANAVMYIRVLIYVFIINSTIGMIVLPYLLTFVILCFVFGLILYKKREKNSDGIVNEIATQQNPLEFKVALLFALFFVLFSYLTQYTEQRFGASGLNLLSFVSGFADVDAYVMSLVQGKFVVSTIFIATSIIATTTSNNIIKAIYCISLAEKKTRSLVMLNYGMLIFANVAAIVVIVLFIKS